MKKIIVKYYRDFYRVYDFSDNVIFVRAVVFILLLVSAVVLSGYALVDFYNNVK